VGARGQQNRLIAIFKRGWPLLHLTAATLRF
jgi:hypothetical protein